VSETIVGRALLGRRSDAFLATKVLPVMPTASRVAEHGRLSALRLGVDVIDLYQIHWPNPAVPLSSQMDGMRRLQDDGLVRHVGVSNFSTKRWQAAEDALGAPVLSNQVQFSLLVPKPAGSQVRHAQAEGRVVIAYSPLAKGLLGGKYDADSLPTGSARRTDPLWLPENVRRAMPIVETVRRIADAHGATPAQVALAWLISHPNVVVIPGASSVDQLRHNVEAADLELKDGEVEELTAEAERFEPLGKPATAREYVRAWRDRD
jgi:aryl-alcohol dehydrogenase-like predicted oxidoreductase